MEVVDLDEIPREAAAARMADSGAILALASDNLI